MKADFSLTMNIDDRVIRGKIEIPKGKKQVAVVIICHGFADFKEWGFLPYLSDRLVNDGYGTILFDYSMNGIGEIPGIFSETEKFRKETFSSAQEDLSFLFQQLREKRIPQSEYVNTKEIYLFGFSRGGGNSILFALDHPEIEKLVVWNSIDTVEFFEPELKEEIIKNGTGYYTLVRTGEQLPLDKAILDDIKANQEKFAFISRMHQLHCPLLIISGTEDVPNFVKGAKQMKREAPNSALIFVDQANHLFNTNHPFKGSTAQLDEAIDKTLQFFSTNNKEGG
jgi:uncharacterized protein